MPCTPNSAPRPRVLLKRISRCWAAHSPAEEEDGGQGSSFWGEQSTDLSIFCVPKGDASFLANHSCFFVGTFPPCPPQERQLLLLPLAWITPFSPKILAFWHIPKTPVKFPQQLHAAAKRGHRPEKLQTFGSPSNFSADAP